LDLSDIATAVDQNESKSLEAIFSDLSSRDDLLEVYSVDDI